MKKKSGDSTVQVLTSEVSLRKPDPPKSVLSSQLVWEGGPWRGNSSPVWDQGWGLESIFKFGVLLVCTGRVFRRVGTTTERGLSNSRCMGRVRLRLYRKICSFRVSEGVLFLQLSVQGPWEPKTSNWSLDHSSPWRKLLGSHGLLRLLLRNY